MSRDISNQELYDIAKTYTYYSDIFNISIGLISNLFILLILTNLRAFRGNQCSFYLIVEAIANIGFILTISPSGIISYQIQQEFNLYIIAQIFGLSSVYTICFATFDQYLSTNHRYSLRQLSTLKLAHRLTIINLCFMSLHSIVFLVFNEIQTTFTCTVYNGILKKYLSFFYYPILNSALPMIITCTCSLLAYHNVRCIVRRQMPIVRRRLDRQLTAMILARVISLISLGFPYIVYSLYQLNLTYTGDNHREIAIATLTAAVCYSLMYANFSINFYLFLFISSRFRRQSKYFFTKQYHRLLKCLLRARPMVSHTNRVTPEINQHVISSVGSS